MQRLQAFKYELMPSGEQQRQMRRFSGACRFVYNKALALQKARYEQGSHDPIQKTRRPSMPTLMEIELRAQLARSDERINLLERKLEHAENQRGELLAALKELVSIVRIHTNATGNNFAWAEMDEAKAVIASVKVGA